MSEDPCESEQTARGNNRTVRSVFFLHCRLYYVCPVFAIHKIRYVQTPFLKDVIETFLHSKGLIEEKVIYTPIPLLPNQKPFLDIQKC